MCLLIQDVLICAIKDPYCDVFAFWVYLVDVITWTGNRLSRNQVMCENSWFWDLDDWDWMKNIGGELIKKTFKLNYKSQFG